MKTCDNCGELVDTYEISLEDLDRPIYLCKQCNADWGYDEELNIWDPLDDDEDLFKGISKGIKEAGKLKRGET